MSLAGIALFTTMTVLSSSAQQKTIDPQAAVNNAFNQFRTLKEGKNADYIPALAKVDPNLFGIALVTVDGKVFTAGEGGAEHCQVDNRPLGVNCIADWLTPIFKG